MLTPPSPRPVIRAACALAASFMAGSPALATETYVDQQIALTLAPGASIDDVVSFWGVTLLASAPAADLYLVGTVPIPDLEDYADWMQSQDPDIDLAEANYYHQSPEAARQMIVVAIGDSIGGYQDQLVTERIALEQAHEYGIGLGTKVAIIDTGLDPLHEALLDRVGASGHDFIDGDTEPWESANGIDDDGDGNVDEGYGHGTMVAGVVALVAPGATLLPYRVLDDEGRGTIWDLALAIRRAADDGADVINLSLGLPQEVQTISAQVAHAHASGAVVVGSAGNESSGNPPYHPAAHPDALMITALDSDDVKADFADWHRAVDVAAPGTGIRSSYPDGRWATGSGCSFATPFLTGGAAIAIGLDPLLTPDEVHELLVAAVDPISHHPANVVFAGMLGSGRINAALGAASLVVSVGEAPARLMEARVAPNPSSGLVRFEVPGVVGTRTDVRVFDAVGRQVATLTGNASVEWDTRNTDGRAVASGVYHALVTRGSAARRVTFRVLR